MNLILFLLFIICPIRVSETLRYCQSGTYEFKPPLGGEEASQCFNCTKILNPQLEVLISECNRTHDAVIQCIPGYYRRDPRNPRENGVCLKCSECHYPYFQARSCQVYEDTGCCLGENYDVVLHNGGAPVCRERPWLCRRGEYFSDASFECLPCPENTFMSLDYHSMRKCWDCDIPLGALHSIVIQPCNSTHPPVIGCEEGFFVNSSMGYKKNDIGCSPCTRCNTTDKKYEARRCDQLHDAVCCPDPDMMVKDTSDGPECQADPPENFEAAPPQGSMKALRYIPETYIDEESQINTGCKDCSSRCEDREKSEEFFLEYSEWNTFSAFCMVMLPLSVAGNIFLLNRIYSLLNGINAA